MKKSLKLVGIFMIVMIVGIVGGLSIYFLVANNKTYYIYDVRIVKPVSGASYYVYTDEEAEYSLMQNQTVYMTSKDQNIFEIGVYAYTSTNTTKVDVTSSNEDVAQVYSSRGHMYVEYKSAGEAKITASIGEVSDTISVLVYDIPAADLAVYDDKYYGEEYSKYFPNQIVTYADEIDYAFRYETSNVVGGEYSNTINNELLKIDYTKIDKSKFLKQTGEDEFESEITQNVYISASDKKLHIKCDAVLPDTTYADIPIQPYYYTSDGEIRYGEPFAVHVKIITYTPQFLQVVVSKTPNFDDGYVFMNTEIVDASKFTPEEIYDDTRILNGFLKYQMAETGLQSQNEKPVYHVYFSEKVKEIYLEFRKVYTNGHIEKLNLVDTSNPNTIEAVDKANSNLFRESKDGTYYILTLTQDYFDSADKTFDIHVSLGDYKLEHTFKFEYASLNKDNVDKFYSYNEETGEYTYVYWDPRSKFDNEISDKFGRVVGFGE